MQEKVQVHEIPSKTSLKIYTSGPDLYLGPLPSFFYFALSGEDSLILDPFNQPTTFLGDSPIRRFSFTLPFHGGELSNTEAIGKWGEELLKGHDVITPFIDAAVETIDDLILDGFVDADHLAVGGLSRGGFIATHIAARDDRVRTILGFAPLTKIGWMHEWRHTERADFAKSFDLVNLTDKLVGRDVRFYIGNRDMRVGTSACYEFIEKLSDISYAKGHRSPPIELMISPSVGYRGHGTLPHTFEEGANWLRGKLCSIPK